MSNTFTIRPSNDGKTKYTVVYNGKTIKFGAYGMSDYTKHRDDTKKERYIKRHSVRENFIDPTTKGFWAKNILWNKKTIKESIDDVKKKLNIIR